MIKNNLNRDLFKGNFDQIELQVRLSYLTEQISALFTQVIKELENIKERITELER